MNLITNHTYISLRIIDVCIIDVLIESEINIEIPVKIFI